VDVPVTVRESVPVTNVIAYWPGSDVSLDSQVVIVSAYYDGLGRAPDGTLYPGANDNASGVATMLEVIRTLQAQGFTPRRTVIFVAWIGGERHRAVDLAQAMKAQPGFEEAYEVVAAIELEGVGAGSGDRPVITYSGRARLSETVQQAARKLGYSIGTRELGLHPDISLAWCSLGPAARTPPICLKMMRPTSTPPRWRPWAASPRFPSWSCPAIRPTAEPPPARTGPRGRRLRRRSG
jgi:hypothetical protein